MDFAKQFPNFIQTSTDSGCTHYGFIELKEKIFKIQLNIPHYPTLTNATVKMFDGLHPIDDDANLLEHLPPTSDVTDLMQHIYLRLDNKANRQTKSNGEMALNRMTAILSQTEQIQKSIEDVFQTRICSSYKSISFSNFSEFHNQHYLQLSINDGGDIIRMAVADHSLPDVAQVKNHFDQLSIGDSSMLAIVTTFLCYLRQLDSFYSNMATIDEQCWVVDPAPATTKDFRRIFKIKEHCFAEIIVDPLSPTTVATNIIGPTYAIDSIRNAFDANISHWDVSQSIHQNLLNIFEMTCFPMQQLADDSTIVRCGICLEYRSDGSEAIPIVSCDNVKCVVVYHMECLRTWFDQLKDSKTFLDVAIGACPYCKEKLSKSFINLLECL